jgi:hypothetical protein
MMWRTDCTAYQTIMVCTRCGSRVAANTRHAARRLAVTHDERAHPTDAARSRENAHKVGAL